MQDAVIPIVVDTDPGVDDAFALAIAATSPNAELLMISTVYGNVPVAQTTSNALRLLALYGRDDVPVYSGAERPLVHPHPHTAEYAHGKDGLGGRANSLPRAKQGAGEGHAVHALAEAIGRSRQPVTVVAIGPLTNVALLVATYPQLINHISRLVVMGGALNGGNVTPVAEFNVWSDPEAARRVLVESELAITLVPIDLTHRAAVDSTWIHALARSGAVGSSLASLSETYRDHYRRLLGRDVLALHDVLAVTEAIFPGTLSCQRATVDVECSAGPARGALVADTRLDYDTTFSGSSIEVAADVHVASLHDLLLRQLTGQ